MEIQIEFFSQNLKNLREEREMTQEALAHVLGVSRQSIIALERGKCLPSLPLAIHFAEVFNMALEDILRPGEQLALDNTTEDEEAVSPIELFEQENAWVAQIQLPEDVDKDKIEAELKEGVLTVTLPKVVKPAPKVTKIQIKTE
jgi:putative transcriptional regulator